MKAAALCANRSCSMLRYCPGGMCMFSAFFRDLRTEFEEPLEAFDEKLFLEIVKSIQINKEDEMSVEFLGGLRFKERI